LLRPLPGGSPYNVAIGLARLGRPTAYVGCLSRDGFGQRLAARLDEEGVDLSRCRRTEQPTTLAVVHLDERQQASYRFYLEGTSAAGLDDPALADLPTGAALHLSFGAVGVTTEPAGPALARLLAREHPRRFVCLDPNVRPAAIGDLAEARRRLEDLLADVDLVKVSDEDLRVLHPDAAAEDIAAEWLRRGPSLVVVTRGGDGAVAVSDDHRVEVAPPEVEVVDTVGAGDAFGAGLLAWLDERDRLSAEGIRGLGATDLTDALGYAARVAGITCTRHGADPPRRDEM
jgi:fructokinase